MNGRDDQRATLSVERDANPALVESLAAFGRACSLVVLLVGLTVLAGWSFHFETFKSGVRAHVAMNPTTALVLILAAGTLWIHQRARRQSGASALMGPAIRTAAVVAMAVGAMTVLGHVLG